MNHRLHGCIPIHRNRATQAGGHATVGETMGKPASLKALADAVLERNRVCNQHATAGEKACNFSLQNDPQKQRACNRVSEGVAHEECNPEKAEFKGFRVFLPMERESCHTPPTGTSCINHVRSNATVQLAADLRDKPVFFLPSGAPDLPEHCPLKIGETTAPKGCRFHSKLLRRMITEGTLPMPDGTCPMRRVCHADSV